MREHAGSKQAFHICGPALAISLLIFGCGKGGWAQTAPSSADHPWQASGERMIENDARKFRELRFGVDPERIYSLAELIDLAESHNPETRVAWEAARAQLAALGVARSELYPTLAAIALSETNRSQSYFSTRLYR